MTMPSLPLHWPDRDASRMLGIGGRRWHVQRSGTGPQRVLLLHGTGSSAHSFAGVRRALALDADVLVPDLPGQGYSDALAPARSTSVGFAEAIAALLEHEAFEPDLVVAHSAGAAVAARLALAGAVRAPIVALGAALLPLGGAAGLYFAPLARTLAARPWLARLLVRRARGRGAVERLIASTGSQLPPAQLQAYRTLLVDQRHLAGTLRMMANWDLPALAERLAELPVALTLVDATGDRTLPAGYAERVARTLPQARRECLDGLGHLAHEEAPARVAALLPLRRSSGTPHARVLPFERRHAS